MLSVEKWRTSDSPLPSSVGKKRKLPETESAGDDDSLQIVDDPIADLQKRVSEEEEDDEEQDRLAGLDIEGIRDLKN